MSEVSEFEHFLRGSNNTPVNPSQNMSSHNMPASQNSDATASRLRLSVEDLHSQLGRSNMTWLVPGGGEGTAWFKFDKLVTDNILGNIRSNLPTDPCPRYKDFPEDVKTSWWNSFAQQFNWDKAHKHEIKTRWEQATSTKYSNHMYQWKKAWLMGKDKPCHLPLTHWNYYKAYWRREDVIALSSTNKKNRCSTNEKPTSTHNNGSRSFERTKKEMTKKANGVEPDHLTVMKVTHTSKKSGRIENKKIEAVVNSVEDMIERRITQFTAEGSSISSLPTEEINSLVYETTEKEKGRVLGLGTLPKTQKVVSSFGSFTSNQELQNKILELQEADAAKAVEIDKMRAQMDAATAKTAEIDMLRAQVEADARAREEMLTWLRNNHNYPK